MTRLPAGIGIPRPSDVTRSPPPGAQAPIHGALRSWSPLPTPVPPKQVQPCPGAAASCASALATCSGGTRNRITWCTISGRSRQHVDAGDERVGQQLRVEQEAAVVVGALALGRRRVRLGQRDVEEALAVAQRHRGRRLAVGVCAVAGGVGGRRLLVHRDVAVGALGAVPAGAQAVSSAPSTPRAAAIARGRLVTTAA